MKINEATQLFDLEPKKIRKAISFYCAKRRKGMSQKKIIEESGITPELADDLEKMWEDSEEYREAKMHR